MKERPLHTTSLPLRRANRSRPRLRIQSRPRNSALPVYEEITSQADPCLVFKALYGLKNPFLLESARQHPKTGRYSFAGADPSIIFKSKKNKIWITRRGKTKACKGDPFEKLKQVLAGYRSANIPGLPGFTGGAVGYFGYDACHFIEKLPCTAKDDLGLPDMYFGIYDTVFAFDHLKGKAWVISHDKSGRRIKFFKKLLTANKSADITPSNGNSRRLDVRSNFTQAQFEKIVKKAKRYIRQGDIYQANLSQRLCVKAKIDPYRLYKRLREVNPSPFACILKLNGIWIVSSSPERLVKLEDGVVETRPIAGTRPRGKTSKKDRQLSKYLLLSPKERAEHIMLVDLERNDIGRVCRYGSVRPNELMVLEKYSHVTHIVSNIKGKLRKGKDAFDIIKAVFPGGTITGTPKVRCMEIIDELEPVTRNIYTGSIGYLGFSGDMDLNIAIRTFVIKDGTAYVQVGAGIVADSDGKREYRETLHKAEALLKAIKTL